jgi:hypothetical protein
MPGMRTIAISVVVLVAITAVTAVAGRKGDLRLLQRLQRVDGTGSGLDCDTVRGLSPDDMKGGAATVPTEALDRLGQRLDALEAQVAALPPPGGGTGLTRASIYARAQRKTLTAGQEDHLYADCDAPADLALSCAGGAFTGGTDSPIAWIGVVQGDGTSTVDRCLVVVKASNSAPTTGIEAEVRCIDLP